MRVEYELLRDTLVEVMVTARRILQWQYLDIYRLRDLHSVIQDRHHKLPIVTKDGTLSGSEIIEKGRDVEFLKVGDRRSESRRGRIGLWALAHNCFQLLKQASVHF